MGHYSFAQRAAAVVSAARRLLLERWKSTYRHDQWEAKWSRDDYNPMWANRGVAPEIVEAANRGWLPESGAMLDVGCGQGEIAGWFAERGYSAVGIDIAEAAVERARTMFLHLPKPPEFYAVDICTTGPPDRQYEIFIDRGCFHQIPRWQRSNFVRNLVNVAAPNARLLLFSRAFRQGQAVGDPREHQRVEMLVRRSFEPSFEIEKIAVTYLDPYHGQQTDLQLPGLCFWMSRKCPFGT